MIEYLCKKISQSAVEEWFACQEKKHNLYSSIDIRYSGYKIAPVDVNLFPAGFNNLGIDSIKLAASIIAKSYQKKKFLIIPENHSRNLYYNSNLLALKKMLEMSGNEAIIAHDEEIKSVAGDVIPTSSIIRENNLLITKSGYVADTILVNNDMITGIPNELLNLKQEIIPDLNVGWFNRKKSCYFEIYLETIRKFCREFDLDEWLISTLTNKCGSINFHKREGLECIALAVEQMLSKMKNKYEQYSVKDKPCVFIKADSGSYGMAVMTVFSAEEVMNINKDARKKMNITKGTSLVTDVLVQEGIPTINSYEDCVAEPLIYCIMGQPVSFLYRYHQDQSQFHNLNKTGAKFQEIDCEKSYKLVLTFVSRLSLLAASIESEYYNQHEHNH